MSAVRKPVIGQALTVLGMHCSGASTLTGLLAVSGAMTPGQRAWTSDDKVIPSSHTTAVVRLNDSLLGQDNLTWKNWTPMQAPDVGTKIAVPLADQARAIMQDQFADADLIVLDDPRMCRLVPFWADVLLSLERAPFYMLILRHPRGVAKSLRASNGLDTEHGLLLWMTYMLEAEAATRGKPRGFTTYDAVFDDPHNVVAQVHDLLDRPIPSNLKHKREQIEAYAASEKRDQDVGGPGALPTIYDAVYEILARWARFGEDPIDHAVLDLGLQQFQAVSSRKGSAANLFDELGQVPDIAPKRVDEFSRLKLTILEQERQLAHKKASIFERDKELAALGQLCVNAKATSEQLFQSVQESETREQDHIAKTRSLTADREKLRHKLDHYEQENTELHALVAKVESKRAALQSENSELHALVAKVEGKRAALQSENTELHALVAKVESKRAALQDENSELHAMVAKVESERAEVQSQNAESHELVGKVEAARAGLQSENTELHARVAKVEVARSELQILVSKIEQEHAALISSRSWRLTRPVRLVGRLFRWGGADS